MKCRLSFLTLIVFMSHFASAEIKSDAERRRIASLYLSETFLNEQILMHIKGSQFLKNLKLTFDETEQKIFARGTIQIPMDEQQTKGLDPALTRFNIQLTLKPQINSKGYLVFEFPLNETFLYPSLSKSISKDKIIIPVQFVSLGLAATRGYLSALSGDFTAIDRKIKKMQSLQEGIAQSLKTVKNEDALAELKMEKKSLELSIDSAKLQREQFLRTSQTLGQFLGAGKDKEFDLNNKIKAEGNSLFLKLSLETLVPYLKDVELEGVKLATRNYSSNQKESYLIIDIDSVVEPHSQPPQLKSISPNQKLAVPPSLYVRLNQDIFKKQALVETKKQKMGDSVQDLKVLFLEDGIHITGSYKKWFLSVPFDTLADFSALEPDVFEVRLRKFKVLGVNLSFLVQPALSLMRERLESALQNFCTYEYLGKEDGDNVLVIKFDTPKLIPAFPNLHVVDVNFSNGAFMLGIGKTQKEHEKFLENYKVSGTKQ